MFIIKYNNLKATTVTCILAPNNKVHKLSPYCKKA